MYNALLLSRMDFSGVLLRGRERGVVHFVSVLHLTSPKLKCSTHVLWEGILQTAQSRMK